MSRENEHYSADSVPGKDESAALNNSFVAVQPNICTFPYSDHFSLSLSTVVVNDVYTQSFF